MAHLKQHIATSCFCRYSECSIDLSLLSSFCCSFILLNTSIAAPSYISMCYSLGKNVSPGVETSVEVFFLKWEEPPIPPNSPYMLMACFSLRNQPLYIYIINGYINHIITDNICIYIYGILMKYSHLWKLPSCKTSRQRCWEDLGLRVGSLPASAKSGLDEAL